ncbi:pyrazinamidase/nicotinamidase [Coprinopsis marcescibilis]|uniref:nicotinamidase n=1 Tax=Coprinopsis marcescibilis TaxID=230819 RepID=A0A5C3L1U0_COPMA|nr:pyrazinamidase/nicotinamidase [Coprinopsis marcescibilis]
MSTSEYVPPTEPIPEHFSSPFVPGLIVIDMQNDFVTGSLAVPGGATIIDKVNEMIKLPFKVKIATRDFHPDNHVSFSKTHEKEPNSIITIFHPEDSEKLLGVQQVLWPVHCVASTEGAEFVPSLITSDFQKVIHKGTHPKIESYSAFQDIWGRGATELQEIIDKQGVTDLFFVGLAGDYCVKYTALDAADLGYRTWVAVDAVKSISQDAVAWDEMKSNGIRFTTVADVEKKLKSV